MKEIAVDVDSPSTRPARLRLHVCLPPGAAAPWIGPTAFLFRGAWTKDYLRKQDEVPRHWLDLRPPSAALVVLPGLPAPARGHASDDDALEDALLDAWETIQEGLGSVLAPPPAQRLLVGLSDGGKWAVLLALVHGHAGALSLHGTPGLGRTSWLSEGVVSAAKVERLWLHAHVEDPNDAAREMAVLASKLPSTCEVARRLMEPGGHGDVGAPVRDVLAEWSSSLPA